MGKVRMGYHTGEVRWGLMTIFRLVSIALELSLNFISFVVYPGFCLKIISRCNWLWKEGVNFDTPPPMLSAKSSADLQVV